MVSTRDHLYSQSFYRICFFLFSIALIGGKRSFEETSGFVSFNYRFLSYYSTYTMQR